MESHNNKSEKSLSNKKSKPSISKLTSSIKKWKENNQIWNKNSESFQTAKITSFPLIELVVSKRGALFPSQRKRILSVYQEKIICFKNLEDKKSQRIHAIVNFDENLLIRWTYKKNDKCKNSIAQRQNITGFNLLKGSRILSFKSNDPLSYKFREILKTKLKFTNFYEDYTLIKMIGKGSFSCVFLGQNNVTKHLFAIKSFSKKVFYAIVHGKEAINNEINCMRDACDHPNILKLYEVYETSSNIFMCLELISGGNLQEMINNDGYLPTNKVRIIMKGLFEGLNYIHSMNLMHRDIKPANILFRKDPVEESDVVIADFGLATRCDVQKYLFYRCGTPGFAAPEIIENYDPNKKYDSVCDVFSAGTIFYKLLTGKHLFKSKNGDILSQNKECLINLSTSHCKKLSPEAQDLLKKTLQKDPNKRITSFEAINHPFFNKLKKQDSCNFLNIPNERPENIAIIYKNEFAFDLKKGRIPSNNHSFSLSKLTFDDLATNTPVLNGHLNSCESSHEPVMKSNGSLYGFSNQKKSNFLVTKTEIYSRK